MNANEPDAARRVDSPCSIRLAERARGARAYSPPAPERAIDLRLDANEGPCPEVDWHAVLGGQASRAEIINRYPSARALEEELARRWGVAADRVIVTAGGDDAIDRACRVVLEAGRTLLLPKPTFEMFERYARLAGGEVVGVGWGRGAFPTRELLRAIDDRTAMIAVVSPNNPTGSVAPRECLAALSEAAPRAMLFVDAAYAEFGDEDLTPAALALPRAVVLRTFSKAYGLAGARVGYAIGPAPIIRAMRAAGGPYPVSGLGLAVAQWALASDISQRVVARVREERNALSAVLSELGARPFPSQANFVLAECEDAERVWRGLAERGVGVRRFAAGSGLEGCLRITCPGEEQSFARLIRELCGVMASKACVGSGGRIAGGVA